MRHRYRQARPYEQGHKQESFPPEAGEDGKMQHALRQKSKMKKTHPKE
jgi:hypothetical protein